jgi:hypothetical protein
VPYVCSVLCCMCAEICAECVQCIVLYMCSDFAVGVQCFVLYVYNGLCRMCAVICAVFEQ